MDDLANLAELLKVKNSVDSKVASIIERPAQIGHAGEYIAATIFGIRLHKSATHSSSDGVFMSGLLTGCTVDIKWYPKLESILDLNPKAPPEYYLVLAGPKAAAISSRGAVRPWVIESVFLFDAHKLIDALRLRGIKLGVATSVVVTHWNEAEIYPVQRNNKLILSAEQRTQLAFFHPTKIGV